MASAGDTLASNAPTRLRAKLADSAATTVREKDDTELRLEKALFGDDAGFLDALTSSRRDDGRSLQRIRRDSDEGSVQEVEDENLADVPDEDLFFLDAGTGELPAGIQKQLQTEKPAETSTGRGAVWYDSDDDRLTVSLASNTRLRKLRDSLDEDVISGREYIERLRRQYERLHPTPEWLIHARKKRKISAGTRDSDDDQDSDVSMDDDASIPQVQPLSELLRSAGSLTRAASSQSGRQSKLRPEVIDIQRTKDVLTSNQSSIDTLQFHPYYPLLLTAGPNSTVALHHISPQPPNPNPLLTSLHITKTPIHTAAFCTPPATTDSTSEPDTTRIFLSSRRRYFHTWALSSGTITKVSRALQPIKHAQKTTESFKISPCSRYIGFISSSKKSSAINILSTTSMQCLSSCYVDSAGGIVDFDWWRDGEGLCVVGKNGEVSEYSVNERRILARWWDEGAVGTTVIACGGSGKETRYIAIGSSSGIVNIYDRRGTSFSPVLNDIKTGISNPTPSTAGNLPLPHSQSHRPSPLKSLAHLTTPTSHLLFSPSSQLLIIASRWKKNALRVVHIPTCTVYRNWPTDRTPLGRVSSVAISGARAREGGGAGVGGDGDGSNGEDGGEGYLAVGSEGGKVRLWEIRG